MHEQQQKQKFVSVPWDDDQETRINQELISLAHLSDPAVGVGKVQRELFDVQVRLKAATAGQPTKEKTK